MERLDSGLIKIKETQEKVNEIAKETKQAQENLIIAEKKCDEALIDIKANEAIVAEKQEVNNVTLINLLFYFLNTWLYN